MQTVKTIAMTVAGLLAVAVLPASGSGQAARITSPSSPAMDADRPPDVSPSGPVNSAASEAVEQEPQDPSGVKVGYRNGFRFETNDGRFLLRVSAGAQLRYTYLAYDDAVDGNAGDYSNFFMRRGRIWWDGHAYSPRFTYYFQLQIEPQSSVNLLDAWINYAFHPMFQVGVGRNKIAYGLEFLHSGFGNNMVDRSILAGETDISQGGGLSRWPGGGTESFNGATEDASTGFPTGGLILFRSQGLQVSGRNRDTDLVFEYQAGIWQGRNTRGTSNASNDHLYSIRVGVHPNGYVNWLSAGDVAGAKELMTAVLVSAYHDTTKHRANAAGVAVPLYDAKDTGFNVAFMARYQGLSADVEWAAEGFTLEDSTLAGTNDFDRGGWRGQVGYFIRPHEFEVVGRYAEVQRLKDADPASVRNSGLGFARIRHGSGVFQDAVEKNLRELTLGATWYLSGAQHQHKLFVDYTRLTRGFEGFVSAGQFAGTVPTQKDNRLRAVLQFRF